jgi:hypothetical protein
VKRNRLTPNFDECWAQGAERGVVKKVVDVRNNAYDLDMDADGSVLSDGGSEDPFDVIKAGELGYCRFLKFKCAAARTCDAWVVGGPITDGKTV